MTPVHNTQHSQQPQRQRSEDLPCTVCDAADLHSERVFNQIQRFYRDRQGVVRPSNAIRYTSAAQLERMKAYSNCDYAASRIRDLNNGYIPSLLF